VAGRGGLPRFGPFRSGTSRTVAQDAVIFPFLRSTGCSFHLCDVTSSMCCSRSTPPSISIRLRRGIERPAIRAVTALPGPALVIAASRVGQDPDAHVSRCLPAGTRHPAGAGPPAHVHQQGGSRVMRRVADLLGQEMASLWGGTFHSIGHPSAPARGAARGTSRFHDLDREESLDLLKSCLGKLELTPRRCVPEGEVLAELFSCGQHASHGGGGDPARFWHFGTR